MGNRLARSRAMGGHAALAALGSAPRIRFGMLLCLTLLFLAPSPRTVDAHAEYRSSAPANGATVTTAPAQVVITFSIETSTTRSNGAVTDAAGTVVSAGWSVAPNERKKMTIALKPNLRNGIYTVKYTSESDDAHVIEGSFIFTLDTPASTGGGAPWVLWLAILAATAAFIVGGLFIVRRSRGEPAPTTASAGPDEPRP